MQTSQAPEFGGAKTDVAGTIVSMLEVAEYAPGAPRGCLHRFWWVEPDDAFFTRLEVTPVRRCPSLTLGYLELRNLRRFPAFQKALPDLVLPQGCEHFETVG